MLSDTEILRALKEKKILISDFDESALTPNGYDLRIGEIMVPAKEIHIKDGKIRIPPLTRFLVGTAEEITLSSEYVAQLWIKSRWARRGVLASFGLVDAGFSGILTLGAFATEELEIEVGQRFAQICFFRLSEPAEKDYSARSGNYQNQKNIKI
ncbi:MAG: dCTP deaminase [Euryarchaeota archaeon]|nr:dCTP deaminase [Euryarchaeota archaeon]